jgi:MFS family permease
MELGKRASDPRPPSEPGVAGGPYRWVALSNTTLGVFMSSMNTSVVLISLPAIFRGIRLDPLAPANIAYLLWVLQSYLLVTTVLVVPLGRIGDMYGRVRMYNLGFAIFTAGSIALSLVWGTGPAGAVQLILFRLIQGTGGALLMANSAAILTDAFPPDQRGLALGINGVAFMAGSFVGLVVGGLLAVLHWRFVFLVSVPVGLFGTAWAYLKLRELGVHRRTPIDWWGNLTLGIALTLLIVGLTYGIEPYDGHLMSWTSPAVIAELAGGCALLALFFWIETRVPAPMLRVDLFRIRAFAAGNFAGLLSSIGRGGLQLILIIWLQGIWLPLHGYQFVDTPFWAGIYMLPLTGGFLIAGPISGSLSDRYGARPFATGGMLAAALTFGLLMLLPADFAYLPFALLLFGNGLAMGLFSSPNTAAIMNSVPPEERGAASGTRATFQNAGVLLSMSLFFSFMIAGMASSLPEALYRGLLAHGVPRDAAERIAQLPPVSTLFAAVLGFNPIAVLLGPVLHSLPPSTAAYLSGREFFPQLIAGPFVSGVRAALVFSLAVSLLAAWASWLRGGRYVHEELGPEIAQRHPFPAGHGTAYGREHPPGS